MSSSALPAVARETWLGHPKGLFLLFATEMWERFSYYGMRALLVLSLIAGVETANPGFGWSQSEALKLYGLFTGFVYFTPLIGGWLADNYLGQRRSVIIGGVLMAIGQFTLAAAIPGNLSLFYIGLVILVLGNALIIGLEGLVVSIQTTRLVLFEFFNRFLRGTGRVFRPLPSPPLVVEPSR